jgi:hypothetical protein
MFGSPGGYVPGVASLIITVAVVPGSPATAGCVHIPRASTVAFRS